MGKRQLSYQVWNIKVSHKKVANGNVETVIDAPVGLNVIQ